MRMRTAGCLYDENQWPFIKQKYRRLKSRRYFVRGIRYLCYKKYSQLQFNDKIFAYAPEFINIIDVQYRSTVIILGNSVRASRHLCHNLRI